MAGEHDFSLEEINKLINVFDESSDSKGAYSYFKELERYINSSNLKETNALTYEKYKYCLAKIQFLAINFFDNWSQIAGLIKNYFDALYDLKYYNFWDKLKINLLSLPGWQDRDKAKEELKKTLLECDRAIINKNKYQNTNLPLTVNGWLKDYNANLGLGTADKLARAQYFVNGENIKILNNEDKEKIKVLFEIYEKMKTPSSTSAGNEDDVVMIVNRQPIVFTEGNVEGISQDVFNIIKSIKTDEITEDNQNKDYYNKLSPEQEKKLKELEDIAEQFAPGTLERRAVEEEIRKLGS